MTGYHIRVGYNSSWNEDDAWRELVAAVERLRNEPQAIIAEVNRVEGSTAAKFTAATLEEYAASYASNADLTLKVHESPEREVIQLASGGGEGRETKEMMRRAFCRLVIAAMHQWGIEVTLVVA